MTPQQRQDAFMQEFDALVKKYGLTFQASLEPNMVGNYQNGVRAAFSIVEAPVPLPQGTQSETPQAAE